MAPRVLERHPESPRACGIHVHCTLCRWPHRQQGLVSLKVTVSRSQGAEVVGKGRSRITGERSDAITAGAWAADLGSSEASLSTLMALNFNSLAVPGPICTLGGRGSKLFSFFPGRKVLASSALFLPHSLRAAFPAPPCSPALSRPLACPRPPGLGPSHFACSLMALARTALALALVCTALALALLRCSGLDPSCLSLGPGPHSLGFGPAWVAVACV